MDIGDSFQNMLDNVISVVPRIVLFLAILVVGWIIARAVLRIVDRVLDRVGFDRAVERGGIRRWIGTYDPSQLAAKIVYYAVLLFVLQLAFGVFGTNPVSTLISSIVAWLPRAFVALVIVIVAAAIGSAVRDVIASAMGGLSYGRILARAAQVFIMALGLIAALNQIGVATAVTTPVLIAALATVGGVVVVGIGGGLVLPMRDRWERILDRAENETATVRDSLRQHRAQREAFTQERYASAQYESEAASRQRPAAGRPQTGAPAAYSQPGQGQEGQPYRS